MVTHRADYGAEAVSAARSVLVELVQLLGEFRDRIVVVGGWVPSLLLADAREPHIGTLDIDLALDFQHLPEASYATLLRALTGRGYRQDPRQDAGPRWVADFLGEADPEARAILQRRVYEEITAWLDSLGVEPWQAPG